MMYLNRSMQLLLLKKAKKTLLMRLALKELRVIKNEKFSNLLIFFKKWRNKKYL